MTDNETRDRVRALVKEVLAKAVPEGTNEPASTPTRFVDTTPVNSHRLRKSLVMNLPSQ